MFRVRLDRSVDTLTFHSLNDGTDTVLDRSTDALYLDGLQRVAAKATALRGAIQYIADLPEVA
jgi:hypothetical protein